MADNTVLNSGSGGDTIASDDIAGVKYQRVKVTFGADGSATDAATTAPLPVRMSDGTDLALVTAAGEQNVIATAQPGVDIGDVTINNASGASAVNIQDGGNSVTVDGTVTANAGTGTFTVDVTDRAARLVGQVEGRAASGAAKAGNPIQAGGIFNTTQPTVTTGQAVEAQYTSRGGAIVATGVDTFNVTASGTVNIGTFPDNEPFNVNQIAGSAVSTVAAGIQRIGIGDGTNTATVRDTGASDSLNVAIVDASGNQITSFGGGTEYTEDAVTPGDPVAASLNLRRRDTPAGEVSASGDWVTANATNYGAQFVQVVTSAGAFVDAFGGSGGTAQADRSAFTDGTTNMTPIGGVFNETQTAPTEDQAAAIRITNQRGMHVNLRNNSGTEVGTSGAPVRVDPTGTTTQPVSGTVTANQGTPASTANRWPVQITDGTDLALVTAAGEVNVLASAQPGTDIGDVTINNASGASAVNVQDGGNSITVDQATATNLRIAGGDAAGSPTAGTVLAVQGIASGTNLNVAQATAANLNATVVQTTAANLNAQVVGDVAHDGVDSGNPAKVGGRAIAHGTNPTQVAAADRTNWYFNRHGVPFTLGGHPNIITFEAAYTAAQTDAAIVTVAAGLKIVVTQIQMTADNANTVDVGFRVGFGATTTPTTTGVVLTHPGVAAGSGISRGDGSGILGVGADGEDLRITSEVPTTGSIRILVSYFTIES